tara:strand:- start:23757 stop:25451 length:1695 start_codon:yes stop_codon:yes gene_type:complete
MKRNGLIILLLFTAQLCLSQQQIPQDYFKSPLDIPLVLSGTFGELRSNHFHSGLDIKTQQKTGLPVYAAADGVVSRIKISHYGYGKALYIQHPNGYTSVYAHLKKFSPEIEAYIKKKQYLKEDFQIEVFPKGDELRVSELQIIAYSGNTGGSGGPHLHFELRDKNARPMNPFLFGLDVADTRKPIISRVLAYPLEEGAQVNGSENAVELRLTQQKNGDYIAEKIKASGRIGFGIGTVDKQDLANNKNGIYSIQTTVNGDPNFNVTMDKFSFAETRYLNRMIDYPLFINKKNRVQKLFVESNNPLSIYGKVVDQGELHIADSLSYQYVIRVRDFKGNKVVIQVPIAGTSDSIVKPKKIVPTDHFVQSNAAYTYEDGKYSIYVPKGALYDNAYMDIKVNGDDLLLHNKELPVHKNIIISYDLSAYAVEDRDKLYIARRAYKDVIYYTGARIKDGKLTASTRTLGDFTIAQDSTPPLVTPKNVTDGKWMSKFDELVFEIDDEDSGISGYRATVNGKFILMEYDYKTKRLVHDFNDNAVTDTENNLKLIVTDNVGNSTIFETTFYRKR